MITITLSPPGGHAMNKKYLVRLTDEERDQLTVLISTGHTTAYKIRHAHMLLKADLDGPAWTDTRIAEAYHRHVRTVEGIRKRCVTEGRDAALGRQKRRQPPCKPRLDGHQEAYLIALRCSEPPTGYARWTLKLLAEKLVELHVVEQMSYQTVCRTLKKTNSSLI